MTYKVLVTCKQMQESLEELLAETPMPDFSFTTPELTKQGFKSSEMAELIKGHDAAIVGDDVVDETVLSVSGLKFVCKWGAGIDQIDFDAAKACGVSVQNTPGVFGEDVADIAVSYLIGLSRKTFRINEMVKNGGWPRLLGRSLRSLKVSIYGLGSIGTEVAKRLVLAGSDVRAYDLDENFEVNAEMLGVEAYSSLQHCVSEADALIVCCPLTDSTRGSVGSEVFSKMSRGAFLVNVSRGSIVVEADLVKAMDEGLISSAALDVYEMEPLPSCSALFDRDVIFGSHNASNSDSSVTAASKLALEKTYLNLNSLNL